LVCLVPPPAFPDQAHPVRFPPAVCQYCEPLLGTTVGPFFPTRMFGPFFWVAYPNASILVFFHLLAHFFSLALVSLLRVLFWAVLSHVWLVEATFFEFNACPCPFGVSRPRGGRSRPAFAGLIFSPTSPKFLSSAPRRGLPVSSSPPGGRGGSHPLLRIFCPLTIMPLREDLFPLFHLPLPFVSVRHSEKYTPVRVTSTAKFLPIDFREFPVDSFWYLASWVFSFSSAPPLYCPFFLFPCSFTRKPTLARPPSCQSSSVSLRRHPPS